MFEGLGFVLFLVAVAVLIDIGTIRARSRKVHQQTTAEVSALMRRLPAGRSDLRPLLEAMKPDSRQA